MDFIPRPPVQKTKVCQRCKLHTPESNDECVHCSKLSDHQLKQFISQHQEQLEGNANLGVYFAIIAAIIFTLMVLGSLNG